MVNTFSQYGQDPFTSYLVGLFHSIGGLTLNTQLNLWDFKNIREEANSFMYLKKQCSEALSLAIIKQWELPEDIQQAMSDEINDDEHLLLSHSASISELISLHEQEKISQEAFDEHLEEMGINASLTEQISNLTQETLSAQN